MRANRDMVVARRIVLVGSFYFSRGIKHERNKKLMISHCVNILHAQDVVVIMQERKRIYGCSVLVDIHFAHAWSSFEKSQEHKDFVLAFASLIQTCLECIGA